MTSPNPGTAAAISLGCKCPMIDNHMGVGYKGNAKKYGWITNGHCPLHGDPPKQPWLRPN